MFEAVRALAFHSLGDLRVQVRRRMKRYNPTPRIVLGLKTTDQMESAKLRERMSAASELRLRKPERRLT